MKKMSLLFLCCLCISGCFSAERHQTDWVPTPYHITVDCCMENSQVQGAIRTALIKRDWHVLNIEENKVYAHISCQGTDADVVFSNTDKYYDINFENIMEADFNNHDCIYTKVEDINYVINRYFKKIIKRNAKLELNASKRAMQKQ